MIRTISPQDMREMERAFLEGTGYPSILLMEHAAQAVVDALSAKTPTRNSAVIFKIIFEGESPALSAKNI